MLTLRQAIRLGTQTLAEVPDPELDAVTLLCTVTGMEPMFLRLNAQESLTTEQEERFRSLLLLRARREPLQYIVGVQYFYGRAFRVDGRVLIPRQETETLCELAIQRLQDYVAPHVLDVCTGSGAIAVTLKKEYAAADVTATDLSAGALAVATENAARHQASIRFLQGDLLAPVRGECFDMIVSNPPYIESEACAELQPEVMREPRLALDGGTDGLDFYRRLAAEAQTCLNAGGCLLMEVGDQQAERVVALLEETGGYRDMAIHQDLYGKNRCVTALRAAFPT